MAGRLARAAAALALVVAVVGSSACAAQPPAPALPSDATRVAATVTVAIYRTLNEGTAEAYVLKTLADGRETPGASQACRTVDGRISRRPSVLANPPFSEPSIQQRDRLLRALGAYEIAAVTVTRSPSPTELALAFADFGRAASALDAVATVHTQGDLFIDDGAAALVSLAARLEAAKDRTAMRGIVAQGRPLVDRLIAILETDVRQRQRDAEAATRLDIELWRAYAAEPSGAGGLRPDHATIPQCGQPAIPAPAVAAADASSSPGSPNAMPELVRWGLAAAQDRSAALANLNLDAFFHALLDLNDAAARESPAIAASLARLNAATVEPERIVRPLLDAPS